MALIEVGTLQYAACSYLILCVTHLQRSLSRNTLIEAAIFLSGSFLHTNLLAWLVI